MEREPTTDEMVDLLKKRRWLPFASSATMTILIELLKRPLSKIEMQRLTNQGAKDVFIRTFEGSGSRFIRKSVGQNELGRNVVKYELTDEGRRFVMQQLDLIKAFYRASEKSKLV